MEASTPQPAAAEPAKDAPAAAEPASAMVRTSPDAAAPEAPEVVHGEVVDYDLDLDAPAVLKVKLGGRPFHAVDMRLKTQKTLIRTAIEEGKAEGDIDVDEDESDKTVLDALQTIKSLDSIYPQVAEVLTHVDGDEEGRPPSREFVEEHLRISTFGALMRALARREGKGSKR